jgi:hypothetical protein
LAHEALVALREETGIVQIVAAQQLPRSAPPTAPATPYSPITNVTTSRGGTGGTRTYRFDQWRVGYVAYATVNGPRSGWSIPFTMKAKRHDRLEEHCNHSHQRV